MSGGSAAWPPQTPPPGPSAGEILVVDDNPAEVRVLSYLLSAEGYRVRIAISGAHGLKAAQLAPPDLILLDVAMPDLSGYEVCRHLKTDPRTQSIPVIFLSARDTTEDKVQAFEVGAADYVTKPFQAPEVLARVQAHLARQRAEREREQLLARQQATRTVAEVDERLRREIAELLHGSVQSRLLVAWHQLGECKLALATDPPRAMAILDQVRNDIDDLRERDVRRASHLLHPSIIDIGLVPAVHALGQRFSDTLGVTVDLDPALVELDDLVCNRIPESVRLVAYRVVEEALTNVCRHARASTASISLALDAEQQLVVVVQDDGRGFDTTQMKPGLGLNSIAGRVDQVGGTWQISSTVGQGTRLSIVLPLSAAREG